MPSVIGLPTDWVTEEDAAAAAAMPRDVFGCLYRCAGEFFARLFLREAPDPFTDAVAFYCWWWEEL